MLFRCHESKTWECHLFQILKDLGAKKRRSVPLLRSLSYHLTRAVDELDLKTISDCIFAVKELSFKDIVRF
jgi:hypothetical protein